MFTMTRLLRYLLLVLMSVFVLHAAKADPKLDKSRNSVQTQNDNALNRGGKILAPQLDNNIPMKEKRLPRKTGSLASSEECREDVERICSHNQRLSSNLEVLSCLTNSREDDEDLSPECHHYLWSFKLNVTKDPKFEQVASEMCKKTIEENEECANTPLLSGKLIPCLILYKDKAQPRQCYNFLVKMATIIYSDYRLICDFVDDCGQDINRLKCGKVDSAAADDTSEPHSQGAVVACLEDKIVSGSNVQEKCAKQIVRLSELSSDDFHLDRHLYFKCKDDRERMCEEVVAGEGKVYKCLFNHKFDHEMSPDCREALTLRQKLVAHDFKSSYNLHMVCGAEIEQNECLSNPTYKTDGINDHNDFIGLSGVLMCLEDTKLSGKTIDERCEAELSEYRRMLSEDYELSPEIVKGCATEITNNCNGGIKKHGETIHCLMALAKKPEFSSTCETAIMHLLKENEEAADYRMDYALAKACNPVVSAACSDFHEGDPMILSCLMDHLHTEVMTMDCRKRLLEMQYFISRDFFLDPVFFKKCSADAKRICEISDLKKLGNEEMTMPYSLVISCLYRHIPSTRSHKKQEKKKETSAECTEEVYKVIHNRALDFDLNPELDKACRAELGQFCSDNMVERGSEVLCLQDNYENITSEDCRNEIVKLTEMEEKDADKVDNILLRACQPEVETYCKDVLGQDDEGRVMECLIEHKYELNHECAAGITHFQLIEMKDIHFSYMFMKDCEKDIHSRCPHLEQGVHTKNDVVLCLSTINRDSAVGQDDPLSEECASQLTVENFHKHEDIRFNPELMQFCQKDIKTICHDIKPGQARMVQCLRSHRNKLTTQCRSHLFGMEEEETKNRKLDFMLMRTCKPAIKELCQMHMNSGDVGLILDCLVTHKNLLDSGCLKIVVEREGEEYSDFNLDPVLHEACSEDIRKKCQEDLKRQEEDEVGGNPLLGKVIRCLKREEVDPSEGEELSKKCSRHIRFIMKEAANDYSLDPMLALKCINSINQYCPPTKGNVVECLKNNYFKGSLKTDQECTVEVARMLKEGRSDVMADPILHGACSNDIGFQCLNVPEGQGRIMSCLLRILDDSSKSLHPSCREVLVERRKMWSYAAMNGVQDIKGLSHIVMESTGKTYLLTVIMIFLICIMLLGILCGRVTKRVSRQRKML